jgi:hypothetical protein
MSCCDKAIGIYVKLKDKVGDKDKNNSQKEPDYL